MLSLTDYPPGAHIGSLRQQSSCDIQIDTKEKPLNGQRNCSITGGSLSLEYVLGLYFRLTGEPPKSDSIIWILQPLRS